MNPVRTRVARLPAKTMTGIPGFDVMTGGGLPRGRATLLAGGPGSGKTIFGLEFLVHGTQKFHEPGIFVAFEETSKRLVANAESFGWKLAQLKPAQLGFIDAQPLADLVHSGDFDLRGMLAALEFKTGAMNARRIVFDALDVVLSILPDAAARRREVYRLHDWLLAHELTALIAVRAGADEMSTSIQPSHGFLQFMVDCAVVLNHRVVQGISQRNLRVVKYRGSSFSENEAPFLIGDHGLEVAVTGAPGRVGLDVTTERVSSGVARLDTMLGGGYYRGATILITGLPGTAKTTLGGAFAAAACRRGEATLFVLVDSDVTEVIRNLASVGIRLDRYVKTRRLRIISAHTFNGSAETHFSHIKALAREHNARCLVIDPVSNLSNSDSEFAAHSVAERLMDWGKADGITMLCTSLRDEMSSAPQGGSPLQLSPLADTWIHLNYLLQAGERNRGLSIIKSRGAAHSNQVRELLMSNSGVTLADAYTAGGAFLMGTMRSEKECAELATREGAAAAATLDRVRLDADEAELKVRLKALQVALSAKQVEKASLAHAVQTRAGDVTRDRAEMQELRGADATGAGCE